MDSEISIELWPSYFGSVHAPSLVQSSFYLPLEIVEKSQVAVSGGWIQSLDWTGLDYWTPTLLQLKVQHYISILGLTGVIA